MHCLCCTVFFYSFIDFYKEEFSNSPKLTVSGCLVLWVVLVFLAVGLKRSTASDGADTADTLAVATDVSLNLFGGVRQGSRRAQRHC